MRTAIYTDQQYVDDSLIVSGLREFHPQYFDRLSPLERKRVLVYYQLANDEEEDYRAYRAQLSAALPRAEDQARAVLTKLKTMSGMADHD